MQCGDDRSTDCFHPRHHCFRQICQCFGTGFWRAYVCADELSMQTIAGLRGGKINMGENV